MDRRSFLTRGSGIALAGAATTAVLTANSSRANAAAKTTPTVFDFGAVGDGSTDDSDAFTKALYFAAQNGVTVVVPGGNYAIAKTCGFWSQGDVGAAWGLQCQGATLLSRIGDGTDVMQLQSSHTVRYFRLTGGLSIKGSGGDGNGLHVVSYGGDKFFYNFLIDGLSVEGAGLNGALFEGDVFEFTVANSYFQDNHFNGMTLANSKGGVVSTVNLNNCFFNQNHNIGMACVDFDSQWGGPTDVRVYGGYARDNQNYGFWYNNGTGQAAIHQVGFENNCRSLSPGDPNGAHVFAYVSVKMRDCAGYNQGGGATYLLKGWFSGASIIDGCIQGAGAAMAATGASRLVHIDGTRGGNVLMSGSGGGFDTNPGCGVTWQANGCGGPSPVGDLDVTRSVSGTA